MEVRLHDESAGGARRFALHLQRRAGKLGVLLQAADGGGERYMLSDAVVGLDLGEDDFVGRVRARRVAFAAQRASASEREDIADAGAVRAERRRTTSK